MSLSSNDVRAAINSLFVSFRKDVTVSEKGCEEISGDQVRDLSAILLDECLQGFGECQDWIVRLLSGENILNVEDRTVRIVRGTDSNYYALNPAVWEVSTITADSFMLVNPAGVPICVRGFGPNCEPEEYNTMWGTFKIVFASPVLCTN